MWRAWRCLSSGVPLPAAAQDRGHPEGVIHLLDPHDLLPQGHPQPERVDDAAVVLQGLQPGRLLVGRDQGQSSDLQQLGGGEEGHPVGEVEDRVHQHALLHELAGQAGLLGGDGHREPRRARPDHDDVLDGFHGSMITGLWRTPRPGG